MDEPDDGPRSDAEARPPTREDLRSLCAELNRQGAAYAVVGGFAMMFAGYPRFTADIDLLIDPSSENEARVLKALGTLPDRAALELKPGEVGQYAVVRIADEFVVDLMTSACGVTYREAVADLVHADLDGVRIPMASPRMLWRMKKSTHREKDAPDLLFLRNLFHERGEPPPP